MHPYLYNFVLNYRVAGVVTARYNCNMEKRRIAIDCDDVIVPTATAIMDWYNQQYGTNLTDIYDRDIGAWGVTDPKTAIERVDGYLRTEEYQQLPPFQDALDIIRKIGSYHELHMVTGRSDFLTESTLAMLQNHFPDIFTSVEFTNFFGQTSRPKSQVCQDLQADLLIDDHIHHAKIVAECGIEVYLFGEYEWNKGSELPKGVRRVKDWHEVAHLILPQDAVTTELQL